MTVAHSLDDRHEERPASILAPSAPADRPFSVRRGALVVGVGYLALVALMLIIGTALTHIGPLERWDESVNRWLAGHRTSGWNEVTKVTTWFVNTLPAIGLAALISAMLALRKRIREAVMLITALVLEVLVFLSVTWVVDRPRPDVVRLNATPSTSSYPSGHTAAATVIFAGLAIIIFCCTRKLWVHVLFFVGAIAVASLVGFARVYRGMHHPTDVFAGAVLGAGCLVVAILAVRAAGTRAASSHARTSVRTAPRHVPSTAA
ncbi:MAG TPA: phosphatase PAP2 family protein [Acidimicrobiia bacterium]|nr:phosphatase PAP2 family protein [Acidimicrobiia bacterium]